MPFVYVMRHEEGHRKVGYSNNPIIRRKALEGIFYADLFFEGVWQHNRSDLVEREAHHILKRYRQGKLYNIKTVETYNASLGVIKRAVNQAIKTVEAA